jgi:hypothetical protein
LQGYPQSKIEYEILKQKKERANTLTEMIPNAQAN